MQPEDSPDHDPGSPRRNSGTPLDIGWVRSFSVSNSRLEGRARAISRWSGPGTGGMAAWLLRVVEVLDLTTLSGNDTVARVRALCSQARSPFPRELRALVKGVGHTPRPAAVCVFPAFLPEALAALDGSGVEVATVAGGFPHGLSALPARVEEVRSAREAGAGEIDVVIRREWALRGRWEALFRELRELRQAAGSARLKVILSTGELPSLNRVGRTALVAMMAGADFVKTSTGKEGVNATLPVGLAMAEAIRAYRTRTGLQVGLKPAGGIRTPRQGLEWLRLAETELGLASTGPSLLRIGASGLLGAVVAELEGLLRPRGD